MIEKRIKVIVSSICVILMVLLIYIEYTNRIIAKESLRKSAFLGELEVKIESLYMNYKQYDSRWASYSYSYTTFEIGGCGPTSIANLAYIKNRTSTPVDVADWLTTNGYSTYKNGTERGGISSALSYYGYNDIIHTYYNSDVLSAFDNNSHEMGIFLMGSGVGGITWTTTGHYITIYDCYVDEYGYHYMLVADSGDRNNDGWFCFETQIGPCLTEAWMCYY